MPTRRNLLKGGAALPLAAVLANPGLAAHRVGGVRRVVVGGVS